jgi:hypothetical protein
MKHPASWRPYLAGALTGLLAIASVWVSTVVLEKPKYLGASTTFVRAAGLLGRPVASRHVADNPYYERTKVKIEWQFMLVLGIAVGSGIAAAATGDFRREWVPPIWTDRFGSDPRLRAAAAFAGGLVALFGARMAGGCPSGHGMSGLMQMSVSGFLAMAGFFGAGVVVANLVYRRKGATS